MRFFVEEPDVPSIEDLQSAFAKAVNGAKLIDGMVMNGDDAYGVVTIATPGDGLFDAEIDEFKDFLEEAKNGKRKKRVEECLNSARAIVAVQVLFGGHDTDTTLDQIDPIWDWLNQNCKGLIQADGEGFYEGSKFLLAVD